MNVFSYLKNVVTGQFAHWNDTNNHLVEELASRASSLKAPQRVVYTEIVAASMIIVKQLLAPHEDERILEIDTRDVDLEQFKELYTLLISSMARTYEALNPSLSHIVRTGYRNLTKTDLEGPPMPLFQNEENKPDFQPIATELWKNVIQITGAKHGTSVLEAYPFTVIYLSSTTTAFKGINGTINQALKQGGEGSAD